jgi:ABC-2 type transport system permease protein
MKRSKSFKPFAVTRRIFSDMRNDKRTLALIFIAPVFAMFVFGWAFSGDVKDVSIIVVDHDQGMLSQAIIDNLNQDTLSLEYMDSEDAAVEKVEHGDAYGVIIIPEGFTANALAKAQNPAAAGDTTIVLRLDKSNINVANTVSRTFTSALLATMDQLGREQPVSVDADNAIYGQNARFMDFFVPGIMAFVVFILSTMLTLLAFVGEKTGGTLDRLLSTPLTEGGVVLGYAGAFSVTGTLQATLLLVIGILVFNITVVGNVLLAFISVALLAVVSQALGILLSSLAKREAQAIQFFPFLILPAFLLAGVFWPVEAIPSWLRPFCYLVPPYYAVDANRAVMLKGWGIAQIWPDYLALAAFAAFFLGLAVLMLKRRKS